MGKGKEREIQDKDFEEERAWLLIEDVPVIPEVLVTEAPQDQAPGGSGTSLTGPTAIPEEEGGLECGCCFSPAPFVCIPPPKPH